MRKGRLRCEPTGRSCVMRAGDWYIGLPRNEPCQISPVALMRYDVAAMRLEED